MKSLSLAKITASVAASIVTASLFVACTDSTSNSSAVSSSANSSSASTDTSMSSSSASTTDSISISNAEGLKITAERANGVTTTYSDIVLANYKSALADAKSLQTALEAFTKAPSEELFTSAKGVWLTSRESYGATEAYRFYDGPIDNTETGPEGQLNAWPLDEAYIDYTYDSQTHSMVNTGLIADTNFEITQAGLIAQNEKGSEANVATGYHAIEFLLWGQDFNMGGYIDDKGKAVSGGRKVEDYISADFAERRKTYLNEAAKLLVADLQTLVDAWEVGSENYRKTFTALSEKEALRRILVGLQTLSDVELSGERLAVALESHDQEDEHSCFSDNTHRDMVQGNLGMYQVFVGAAGKVTGTGVSSLIDSTLKEKAETAFEAAKTAVEAIQAPFDYEISDSNAEGNARVQAAIDALKVQGDVVQEIATAVGIENLALESK
jgi:putative iron-regulated protein